MTPFSFDYGPRVRSGSGAAGEVAALLPPGPVLFVTDAGVRRLGLCDPALEALAGRRLALFDAVEADPSQAAVEAAVAAGRAAGVASVVGFGGGSPMDVAKLVAYLLGSGDALDTIWGVEQATGKGLPLVLVPTTAGTGSEATPISVITVGGSVKKAVNARALTAGWAILDAELTIGLPPAITAATGIDAIVHAIEAHSSKRLKNPLSDALAREALRLLGANLRTAVRDGGDLAARGAMLLGAHLAGVAFANAPVAGVHALAYPLGGHFHVPHGLSNALMLPHVLRHNMREAKPLYAELAPILGSDDLVGALVGLMADCALPSRLRDVGVTEAHLDLLADEAMKQERLLVNNPCPISRDEARALYAAAL